MSNNISAYCFFDHNLLRYSYSRLVVILHNRQWMLVSKMVEHFSRGNESVVLLDTTERNISISSISIDSRVTLVLNLSDMNLVQVTSHFDSKIKIFKNSSTFQESSSDSGCSIISFLQRGALVKKILLIQLKAVRISAINHCNSSLSAFDCSLFPLMEKTRHNITQSININKTHLRIGMIVVIVS